MVPVTVVHADPNVITQVKTAERDGYTAVQVGSGSVKKSNRKPQQGHLKGLQSSRWMREFRLSQEQVSDTFERGFSFGVEIFRPGDCVQVTGTSKGHGFQGVVKRHNFSGAPKSHGTKDQLRMPGSIGAAGVAHVFKGLRMPGRMGNDTVTVKGLRIVKVDTENNLLYILGALPGSIDGLLEISGPGTFKIPAPAKNEEPVAEESQETSEEAPEEAVQPESAQEAAPAETEAPAEEKEAIAEVAPEADTAPAEPEQQEQPVEESKEENKETTN